ncbi:MAG: hypothetical protein ACRD27_09785 [Terracidiphilus sp.]
MTDEEVREIVRLQACDGLTTVNDHRTALKQALVPPQAIFVLDRTAKDGLVTDREQKVWLVGQENSSDGYKIIMRDDGLQFGLASPGFPADKYPILCGWYGSLTSAFLGM